MSNLATITIPRDYGYVLLTLSGTFFLGLYHGLRIGTFRRAARMAYPKAYADSYDISTATPEMQEKMYLFNCAQRSHGNYLENVWSLAIALLISGVKWPRTSAGLGVVWLVCRALYMVGYTQKDKKNGSGRLMGSGFWLAQVALYGMAGWVGLEMVM